MEFVQNSEAVDAGFVTEPLSPLSEADGTPLSVRDRKNFTDVQGADDDYNSDEAADEYATPLTAHSIATNGTESSGVSLADIEHELHEIIAKVNAGQEYNEKRLDTLIALQTEHPEHQARQREELHEWTKGVEDYLAECLVSMRTFVPVNIACSSKSQMQEENAGLSDEVVRRVHEKKPLWLVRLDVDDINRLHEVELRDRYNPTGESLDVVELAAVYAAYPEDFTSDPTGKKTDLKLAVMHLLQKLLRQRDEGELPDNKRRHPAYAGAEYGPIDDITSTYSTRVVSGISADEFEGIVAPRRSFDEVCGKHSILSQRDDKTPSGKFTNVFAQYSGPDLVHVGWLKKETGVVFSVYQSRYVVLTRSDKMLRYFKREDDTATQGTCDLSMVADIFPSNTNSFNNTRESMGGPMSPSVEKEPQKVAGSACRFQLVNDQGKVWTFEAPTTEERDTWVGHIEYVWMAMPDTSRISISDSGGGGKYGGRLSFSPGGNKAEVRSP